MRSQARRDDQTVRFFSAVLVFGAGGTVLARTLRAFDVSGRIAGPLFVGLALQATVLAVSSLIGRGRRV